MADRTYVLKVRLNKQEKEKLQKDCEKAKINQSKYVRMLILNKEIKSPPDINYFKFMTELKRIGNNLNQLVKGLYNNNFNITGIEEVLNNLNQFILELTKKVRG